MRIHYRTRVGHYADGSSWILRSPQYLLSDLKYGPVSKQTILEPRLAPALFGIGLLEGVPDIPAGRFGWQGTAVSIRDQTTKAFARDMGLTSSVLPNDDCTAVQQSCRAAPNGGTPEVSDELLAAVIEFQRYLAVPERGPIPVGLDAMNQVFKDLGCAACHRDRLPTTFTDADGSGQLGEIEPYTDLLLHDLGSGLADRTVSGVVVPSRWRTAPLWGLAYRLKTKRLPTFFFARRPRPEDLNPSAAAKAIALGPIIQKNVHDANVAGVKIAFGTDTMGLSAHGENAQEFALLVQAGLSPIAAIKAATVNAADLIGDSQDIGSAQAGRYADLIAVNGDPLADITVLENVAFVMKGVWCTRPEARRLLHDRSTRSKPGRP